MTTKSETTRLDNIGILALIGAGKMGSAMLEGWLALGLDPRNVVVIEPQPSPEMIALSQKGIALNPPAGAVSNIATIVLAVKPQVAAEVMSSIAASVEPGTLVLSIMAGKTLGFLQSAMPNAAIIRAMPNTPAAIGRGITVAVPNAAVTAEQKQRAHALLAASGAVEWISDESLMDAVTAVSGSGPAYVFLLAEALARAGVAAGLPEGLAATLARETVAGAGELLHRSSLDAATLRKNVTSPGGTTAAALEVLMQGDGGLDPLMRDAVAAATKRSRDLAG
ncbi:pyrroline-5-carboxylate reductase [Pseudorhodoplanes sinuspersici]|uniref:Pyrroline-5-carboxylate reductase n=1 Tax=Pseudorhodoplanes sinuspersici TaxID=1235591 RepID=A0A1W6ZSA4_9HYPH|nr:pyrroline-5-carboxylate reductase [Pseudorhodoplanes sinuspersici]ARP99990.1 pyrroline-5-carboxylate reductase [Pseudorhodoplanes sinuspersici]RKE71020.1 pyrroline-5-carboxylate reductase [Pseudorhodoplanes sinuspersici]